MVHFSSCKIESTCGGCTYESLGNLALNMIRHACRSRRELYLYLDSFDMPAEGSYIVHYLVDFPQHKHPT